MPLSRRCVSTPGDKWNAVAGGTCEGGAYKSEDLAGAGAGDCWLVLGSKPWSSVRLDIGRRAELRREAASQLGELDLEG
jgi:hypothetical protein